MRSARTHTSSLPNADSVTLSPTKARALAAAISLLVLTTRSTVIDCFSLFLCGAAFRVGSSCRLPPHITRAPDGYGRSAARHHPNGSRLAGWRRASAFTPACSLASELHGLAGQSGMGCLAVLDGWQLRRRYRPSRPATEQGPQTTSRLTLGLFEPTTASSLARCIGRHREA